MGQRLFSVTKNRRIFNNFIAVLNCLHRENTSIKRCFNLAETSRAGSAHGPNKRCCLRAGEGKDKAARCDGVGVPGGLGSPQTTASHRVTDGARSRVAGDILPLLLFPRQHLLPWTKGTRGLCLRHKSSSVVLLTFHPFLA